MTTANSITDARMPAGAPNPMPRLQWPTDEVLAARARQEIAPQMRANGRTEEQIELEVSRKVEDEKKKHEKLRGAHKDFEAFFVGMLLTEMKKTVKKNEMFDGGRGEEIFEKRLTDEQAKMMVSRGDGFGIARMMDQAYLRSLGSSKDNATGEWRVPSEDVMQLAKPEERVFDSKEYGRISPLEMRSAKDRAGNPLVAKTEFLPTPRMTTLTEGLTPKSLVDISKHGAAAMADGSAKAVEEVRDRANRANGLKAYAVK